ncbi:hypothetical protein CYPRO_0684 [Cyclonatronum proteinivorum]|uniref:Uncharacterized protein n=1 Tax=Cyclonatronum proteinivorum TaxID=1457365 RepID=A0A345UHL6_9BACT|nr:hypothetical protein [Cyclonatronum proteinivorum]AXI99967.1 hypothetical protein CYPRO_0684 [Cyclonatronum proteinivorum]
MAEQIALTAKGMGFYSIWCKIFKQHQAVVAELRYVLRGTHFVLDSEGNRTARPDGII